MTSSRSINSKSENNVIRVSLPNLAEYFTITLPMPKYGVGDWVICSFHPESKIYNAYGEDFTLIGYIIGYKYEDHGSGDKCFYKVAYLTDSTYELTPNILPDWLEEKQLKCISK